MMSPESSPRPHSPGSCIVRWSRCTPPKVCKVPEAAPPAGWRGEEEEGSRCSSVSTPRAPLLHVRAMSAPPKRPRGSGSGDDGDGFEGLVRPVLLLGSPDQKKSKSSTQGHQFPRFSEYAPPINTSSNILIAANPFDDEYSVLPPPRNPYFLKAEYVAAGDYRAFRNPANLPAKFPPQFSGSYALRPQPASFQQERLDIAFGKPHYFSAGAQDHPDYYKQPFENRISQTISLPGQHFKSSHLEDFHPVTIHRCTQINNSGILAIGGPSDLQFNPLLKMSHPLTQSQNKMLFTELPTRKEDFQPSLNRTERSSSLQKNSDGMAYPSGTNLKNHKVQFNFEKSHNVTDHVNSGSTNGTRGRRHTARVKAELTANEKCTKWLLNRTSQELYLCSICANYIHNVADAIRCELCQKVFHRSCTGLTETAFMLLTAEPAAVWSCESCLAKDFPLVITRKSIR